MPTQMPYTGAPIPTLNDGDNVPAAMQAYAEATESMHVLYATDKVDRDTRYADVPPGTIVSATTTQHVWQKRPGATPTWWTVAEYSFTNSGILIPRTGWEVATQQGWVINGLRILRVTMTYTGDADIVASGPNDNSPGNVAGDPPMADVNEAWRPPAQWNTIARGAVTSGNAEITTGGVLRLTDLATSGKLRTGEPLHMNFVYPNVAG